MGRKKNPLDSNYKTIESKLALISPKIKKDFTFEINAPNPVRSTYLKRMEFRHLKEMVDNEEFRQIIIPDFGFNVVNDLVV